MGNKSKNYNKKWLIVRLKTSGSKRRHVIDGDYADTRNSKRNREWENLPTYEGMGKSFKFFNSKINYGLLIRFLRGKVGNDWDDIYDEILQRIPTDLLDYKDCVQWFVADLVERRDEGLWDKREQKYLRLAEDDVYDWNLYVTKEFYVDPDSNQLIRLEDFPSKRKTKGMSSDELRAFRENERQLKLKEKLSRKSDKETMTQLVKAVLREKRNEE